MPSLNEVISENRANRYKGAKLKKDTEALIIAEIKKQKVQPVMDYPVEVFLRWVEPNRKRDVDNVQSSKKFVLDAMVKAGLLVNDSQRYVAQIYDVVEIGDSARVEVEVIKMTDKKALECADALAKFCTEQKGCQNCVFRKYGADNWDCNIQCFAFNYDRDEVSVNAEAKRKNHGYI